MRLFAVRDVKADSFGAPMSIPTIGLALRSFGDACMRPDTDLFRYPEDYMLYELGEYEPNSGEIKPHKVPVFVVSAVSVKQQMLEEKRKRELVQGQLELPVKTPLGVES